MKPIVVILSAPSGSGKGTIAKALIQDSNFAFSISAVTRPPRGTEKNGVDYYFMDNSEFLARVANNEFIEHEEVYSGIFYGTTKKEVDRILAEGKNIIFDVDVVGGINLKKYFGEQAVAIFVKVPSLDVLRERLIARATDTPEAIEERLAKAKWETELAPQFDYILLNDDLTKAITDCREIVKKKIEEYNK